MAQLPPREDFLRDARYAHERLTNLVKLLRPHCPDADRMTPRVAAHTAILKAQTAVSVAIDKEGSV